MNYKVELQIMPKMSKDYFLNDICSLCFLSFVFQPWRVLVQYAIFQDVLCTFFKWAADKVFFIYTHFFYGNTCIPNPSF